MKFQPILPVPLYGKEANRWNLITRPTLPVLFRQPVPGYIQDKRNVYRMNPNPSGSTPDQTHTYDITGTECLWL
jgi:hypothetical protein